MSVRVLLVDDHAVVRRGLRSILDGLPEVSAVEEAETGRDGLHKALDPAVDVVVLDVELPDLSGLEILALIHERRPKLPVVMFSMHRDQHHCVRALRAGALGYVTKQEAHHEIARAVSEAARGRRWVSPAVSGALVESVALSNDQRAPHEFLSGREFEVLCRLGAGATPTGVARSLGLSVKTVSGYRTRILQKLCLESTPQLIRYAVEHGLVV